MIPCCSLSQRTDPALRDDIRYSTTGPWFQIEFYSIVFCSLNLSIGIHDLPGTGFNVIALLVQDIPSNGGGAFEWTTMILRVKGQPFCTHSQNNSQIGMTAVDHQFTGGNRACFNLVCFIKHEIVNWVIQID